MKLKENTDLNEFKVKKPLDFQNEEMRLYNFVRNLTNLNPALKAVSSNASRG
jgi:hypothetical protein